MALWMEYIVCLGLRPTSRSYGKSTVSDKPACRGGMRCVPDSRAVFSGACPVLAMGLAAQQLCVCSVCTPRMVCWDCHCLGVLFYRCAGLFGRLRSVGSFPSGWVLEGSGIAVSLLSNFIPVSSCSWSPLERLILSLLLWSSGILAIN